MDRHRRSGDGGGTGLAQICTAAAARCNQRAGTENHRDDRLRARRGKLLAHARQVSAGDVTGLVREHADDLIRRLRFHQRAAVDEDAPTVCHERVERAVVDDDDLNVLLCKTRRAQNRLRVLPQQLLDFRVADDGQPLLRVRRGAGGSERGGGHKSY